MRGVVTAYIFSCIFTFDYDYEDLCIASAAQWTVNWKGAPSVAGELVISKVSEELQETGELSEEADESSKEAGECMLAVARFSRERSFIRVGCIEMAWTCLSFSVFWCTRLVVYEEIERKTHATSHDHS